ncbi:MAG: family 78 glycoside hydrolase catalytic domain [Acidobacteriaceae bacterium]
MSTSFKRKQIVESLLLIAMLVIFERSNSFRLKDVYGASQAAEASPGGIEWQGRWIWPSTGDLPAHPNQFVQFRKVFTLQDIPAQAHLAVFADSRYQLYVNGDLVGRGPARAPMFWGYYDVFDVAKYLKPGQNVIAAEVVWLDAPMGWYGAPPGAPDHGGLLCQLVMGSGGDKRVIATDPSWKVHEDASVRWGQPRINGALPEVEVTDGSLADTGWTGLDFDDSGWLPVTVTTGGWGKVDPPIDPFAHMEQRPMRNPIEVEIAPTKIVNAGWTIPGPASSAAEDNADGGHISPKAAADLNRLGRFISVEPHHADLAMLSHGDALLEVGAGHMAVLSPRQQAGTTSYVILDMGKEVDGYPQITLDAPAGTLVELGWSEMLTDKGNVTADRSGGNFVGRYFTRQGLQTWSMWGWHGMRYLELRITGNTVPVRIHAGLIFSTAHLERSGSFESSDPLLNKLWQMGAYTFQLCALDGTMDCPTREQSEFAGDGEVDLKVNDVVNDDPDVDRKLLLDSARDQRQDGAIPAVLASGYPEDEVIDSYIFSFVDAASSYYLQTGDRRLVDTIYPNIVRAMMWFQAFRQKDGMLGEIPYWEFLDWSRPNTDGESSIMNALYVHALENAAHLATMENDTRTAKLFQGEAEEIRGRFNARFWNAERGLYVDSWKDNEQSVQISQLANADAVLYGFAPKHAIPAILQKVSAEKNLKSLQFDLITGRMIRKDDFDPRLYIKQAETYGTSFVLEALTANGFEDMALETIRRNWGPMAAAGNGTMWEQFKQLGGSSCHGWSASPTYVLSRTVLGVRPTSAGYASYTVAPQPGDLTWAKGVVPTPKGKVMVSWRVVGGANGRSRHLELELTTPFAASVSLVVPRLGGEQATTITMNGQLQNQTIHLSAAGDYRVNARFP